MLLFKRKEPCSICGGEVSRLLGHKLSDGALCSDCRRNCTQYLSDPGYLSVEDIKRNMEARTANQALYTFFNPVHVGATLYVDFQNQLWCLGYETESKQAYIFHFEELIDYQFIEDGKKIPRNNIDRATRDGFLFGKMGLWERKGKGSIDNLSVLLTVKNEWIDRLTINIVHSTIQNGTLEYNNYLHKFEHIVQALEQMIPIQ